MSQLEELSEPRSRALSPARGFKQGFLEVTAVPSLKALPRWEVGRKGLLGRGTSKDLAGRNSMMRTEKYKPLSFSRGALANKTPY